MRILAILLAAAAMLAGCDQQRIAKLEEGLSTEADVRKHFGEPLQVSERSDGSKVLEYPRQPEGWTNYVIVIGTDGKMSSLRQLLTPANVAKVQPGMEQAEVRRTLGRPAATQTYALKPDEESWDWRYMDGQQKKMFTAIFGRDRRVIATTIGDDPRQTVR
jgi:outer membrane protein assembly factor BamE (lipoprotein component of BamABCDE complex)